MKCLQTHIDRYQLPHFLWVTFPYLEIGITSYRQTKGSRWYLCYLFAFLHEKRLFFFKSVMEIDTDEILMINVAFVFFFVPFVSLQSASLDLIDNDTVPLSSTNDPQYG